MADKGKINASLVERRVETLSDLRNPSMFKDMINFCEPALDFFGVKLKVLQGGME